VPKPKCVSIFYKKQNNLVQNTKFFRAAKLEIAALAIVGNAILNLDTFVNKS
jgi:hypothetical protein